MATRSGEVTKTSLRRRRPIDSTVAIARHAGSAGGTAIVIMSRKRMKTCRSITVWKGKKGEQIVSGLDHQNPCPFSFLPSGLMSPKFTGTCQYDVLRTFRSVAPILLSTTAAQMNSATQPTSMKEMKMRESLTKLCSCSGGKRIDLQVDVWKSTWS